MTTVCTNNIRSVEWEFRIWINGNQYNATVCIDGLTLTKSIKNIFLLVYIYNFFWKNKLLTELQDYARHLVHVDTTEQSNRSDQLEWQDFSEEAGHSQI